MNSVSSSASKSVSSSLTSVSGNLTSGDGSLTSAMHTAPQAASHRAYRLASPGAPPQTAPSRPRVGVIAADPLRSMGLIAILEDTVGVEAVLLQMSESLETDGLTTEITAGLDALLLDTRAALDEVTEMVARIRRDRVGMKIVIMGAPLDPDHVQLIIGAGAKGFVAETATEGEIKMAMDVVLDGSIWAPRKVLARLIDAGGVGFGGIASPAQSVVGIMTPRELEVLHLLMDGRTNRDIASAMGIDEVTVKAHLGRMLRKTHSSNRVELTLRAIEERASRIRPMRPIPPMDSRL